jgi:hypothetical protein
MRLTKRLCCMVRDDRADHCASAPATVFSLCNASRTLSAALAEPEPPAASMRRVACAEACNVADSMLVPPFLFDAAAPEPA